MRKHETGSDYKYLYNILGKPKRGKFLAGDGDRAEFGKQTGIGVRDFVAHCYDELCLAVSCVNGQGEAIFLAWDIDRGFHRRLAAFHDVFKRRGWADAAMIVEGSGVGRGKVILCLEKPIPQGQGVDLTRRVLEDVKRHEAFGAIGDASEVSVFPQEGQGGVVRIFGRNRKRRSGGLCEAVVDWDGSPRWEVVIVPVSIPLDDEFRKRKPFVAPRADVRCIIDPPYAGRGADVFADMLRLAREAIRVSGVGAPQTMAAWCDTLLAFSPDLRASSASQLRRDDVRRRALRYAREGAQPPAPYVWRPATFCTIHIPRSMYGANRDAIQARKAYDGMADFAVVNRIDPHAFGITYARLADISGLDDKKAAHRALYTAEALGLLARLDNGEPKRGGLCTIVTLRGEGETIDDALRAGMETDAFQQRVKDRAIRGLGVPFCMRPSRSLAA